MRIALLNLPIDNNYGGNLQRYALMKVLQDMGHDVTHISLYSKARLRWYMAPLVYLKRFVYKYLFGKSIIINQEVKINQLYQERLEIIKPFYNEYIKHTTPCYTVKDIQRVTVRKYDAFVVGSDQCWRKDMNDSVGWKTFLFNFLTDKDVKRIAYGASFGKETTTYNETEAREFNQLYKMFTAVSVRERTGLDILCSMGCTTPTPQVVLDPTLLLNQDDYQRLMEKEKFPSPAKGKVFCYVLDKTDDIEKKAQAKASELGTEVVFYGIKGSDGLSIEMWLKSIYEAEYVITDSYHGSVFSLIFNKPFDFCGNERRGNTRVENLFNLFGIEKTGTIDYSIISPRIEEYKKASLAFLSNSLK